MSRSSLYDNFVDASTRGGCHSKFPVTNFFWGVNVENNCSNARGR